MAGPRRNHEVVVAKHEPVEIYDVMLEVEIDHLAKQDFDIFVTREDFADGRCDVRGRQSSRGDLVKQRLEGVMVPAVHDGDLNRQTR